MFVRHCLPTFSLYPVRDRRALEAAVAAELALGLLELMFSEASVPIVGSKQPGARETDNNEEFSCFCEMNSSYSNNQVPQRPLME